MPRTSVVLPKALTPRHTGCTHPHRQPIQVHKAGKLFCRHSARCHQRMQRMCRPTRRSHRRSSHILPGCRRALHRVHIQRTRHQYRRILSGMPRILCCPCWAVSQHCTDCTARPYRQSQGHSWRTLSALCSARCHQRMQRRFHQSRQIQCCTVHRPRGWP